MEQSEDELEMVVRYVVVRGFLRSCGVEPDKIIESAAHKRLNKKLDDCTPPLHPGRARPILHCPR
jgi:hypothetical protein